MTQLRELRKIAGLTQAELAKAAGITREQVCLIENGRRKPSKTTEKVLREVIETRNLYQHTYISRYGADEDEKQKFLEALPEEPRRILMKLNKPRDLSKDTDEAVARLEELETNDSKSLGEIRIVVQSRYSIPDWQVVNGLAALSMYRAFPRTFYLKLLSEDFRELGAFASIYQRLENMMPKRKKDFNDG